MLLSVWSVSSRSVGGSGFSANRMRYLGLHIGSRFTSVTPIQYPSTIKNTTVNEMYSGYFDGVDTGLCWQDYIIKMCFSYFKKT